MFWRPRFILPAINLAIATPLVIVAYVRFAHGYLDTHPPELVACYFISLPAAFLRFFTVGLLHKVTPALCPSAHLDLCYQIIYYADPCLLLFAVGMTWYLVGLEIEARGREKRALVPSRIFLRIVVDLALIVIGVLIPFAGVGHWAWHPSGSIWLIMQFVFFVAWGIAFTVVYGQDLIRCIAQWRHQPT